MEPDIPEDRMAGRAVPLPEEKAEPLDEEVRRGAAAEILADSERRVAEASDAPSPGSAADEHRRSEEAPAP